jgi:L-lactate dehydrogenase complex protein LldG
MENKDGKSIILNRIQKALATPVARPFDADETQQEVYKPVGQDLDIAFAEAFVALQGQFAFCLNETHLQDQLRLLYNQRKWNKLYCADATLRQMVGNYNWHPDLATCDASLTGCEVLVARTGTMVLSSAQPKGRTASVYAPVHICVAYTHQLVPDLADAFDYLQAKYGSRLPSFITFASGPSRTADIEKTLVTGVHGPKEVFCFLVET